MFYFMFAFPSYLRGAAPGAVQVFEANLNIEGAVFTGNSAIENGGRASLREEEKTASKHKKKKNPTLNKTR